MQLNDNTINILKNFAGINSNLLVEPGKVLRTMAEARNILATAELDQDLPGFGIHDLNEFLSALSLMDSPDLTFGENYVTIADGIGRSRIKYFYSDKSVLTYPQKEISMPSAEVTLTLDSATLDKVRRAASAFGYDKLSITAAESGALRLTVVDNADPTSNSYSIDVAGSYREKEFNFVINIGNIKILSGDYTVDISSKLISKFSHKEKSVNYFIALEKSSTFGG